MDVIFMTDQSHKRWHHWCLIYIQNRDVIFYSENEKAVVSNCPTPNSKFLLDTMKINKIFTKNEAAVYECLEEPTASL